MPRKLRLGLALDPSLRRGRLANTRGQLGLAFGKLEHEEIGVVLAGVDLLEQAADPGCVGADQDEEVLAIKAHVLECRDDLDVGQALFVGDWAMGQLWLFWVAPIAGAMLAGFIYKVFEKDIETEVTPVEPVRSKTAGTDTAI